LKNKTRTSGTRFIQGNDLILVLDRITWKKGETIDFEKSPVTFDRSITINSKGHKRDILKSFFLKSVILYSQDEKGEFAKQ